MVVFTHRLPLSSILCILSITEEYHVSKNFGKLSTRMSNIIFLFTDPVYKIFIISIKVYFMIYDIYIYIYIIYNIIIYDYKMCI